MDIQLYQYDKDEIKNSLTLDDIMQVLEEFHAEPELKGETIISRTICHNHTHDESASKKLYYYDNTHLFRCFTGCDEPLFDIFELVRRVKNREEKAGWELPQAVDYIARMFGFQPNDNSETLQLDNLEDWKIFERYDRIKDINIQTQEIELKEYDGNFLKNLPQPIIRPWIEEGMTEEELKRHGIRYNPKTGGIVIPHYDINNRLVGIRERTMVEENEKYGKYRPAYFRSHLYNHPLSYNLYNLNNSKENIKKYKKAIVFEGEKSPILYSSYFGAENDISVACCGSSFIQYQAWLLINLGVEEIIIGLDKQFQEKGDQEFKKLVRNLKGIHRKYGHFIKISFLFDKEDLLDYKSSPIDHGSKVFQELYRKRVNLYNEI